MSLLPTSENALSRCLFQLYICNITKPSRDITERYGSIMEPLQSIYGAITECYIIEPLYNLAECYRTLRSIAGRYGTLQKRCGLLRSIAQPLHYIMEPLQKILILPTRPVMHSSAACASCTMPTANESTYSPDGTLHPHHFSPLSHQSLAVTFTLNLTLTPRTILIPLPPLASIPQA